MAPDVNTVDEYTSKEELVKPIKTIDLENSSEQAPAKILITEVNLLSPSDLKKLEVLK